MPFIDYKSLSTILSNVDRDETEKSAQFIFKVIEKIGIERFYQNCYVTNISKFGYSKKSSPKNVNYPDLPERVQRWLYKKFIDEMNAIKPEIIIPLSKDVANTLQQMKNDNSLDIKIGERLNHPAWIMTYKKNEEYEWVEKYCLTILELFK